MTEQETNSAQPSLAQVERSSRRKRASHTVSRGFSRLLDAEVEFVGGVIKAAGSGLDAFGESLPERREAPTADWTRSLLGGLAEGYAVFLEEVSKTVRSTSGILLEDDEEEAGTA